MGKIWFGNAEKMMWVNCPSTNIQRGRGKWEASGGFLNGGAYVKSSPMSHRKYSIDWNLMESYEAAKIMSYYEGVYGQSPIHFVDPFAAKSNILPLHWSTPRLCAEGEAPSLAGVAETADGAFSALEGAPSKGAFFPSTPAGGPRAVIPVPPGENLYIGAQGGTSTVLRTNQARNPGPKYMAGTQVYATNLIPNPSFEAASGTVEVRRNLIPNPSFETGVAGVLRQGSLTATQTSFAPAVRAGDYAMEVTVTGTPSPFSYIGQNVTVSEGQWLAAKIPVRASGSAQRVTPHIAFFNGSTFLSQAAGTRIDAPEGVYVTPTYVKQAPAGTTQARVYIYMHSTTTDEPLAGATLHTDAWVACAAATEAEALAQIETYFDGATSPDSDLTPSWTGAANASESVLAAALVAGVTSAAGAIAVRAGTVRPERVGDYVMAIDVTGAPAWVRQFVPVSGVDGQWVAFSALVGRSTGASHSRILVRCFGAGGALVGEGISPYLTLRDANLDKLTVSRQIPVGTARIDFFVYLYGAAAPVTPQYGRVLTDAWIACAAPSEAEALAQVQTYFDGSTTFETALTPAWSGTPHASSSTLTGASPAAWYPPNFNTFQYVSGGAYPILRARTRGNNADTYVDPYLNSQPVTGQWVAMGVDVWAYNTTTANNMAIQIPLYNGATGTGPQRWQTPIPHSAWTRLTHVRQITDAGTGGLVVRCLVWPLKSTETFFAVRNYVVAYADTEAEARAMVATRLDGDMVNEVGGKRYSWGGTPGLSNSIETAGATRSVPAGSGLKVKDSSGVVRSVPYNNGRATSLTLVDPGTCEVYYTGGFLSGAIATIGTEEPKQNVFRPGEGNTGLRFVVEPTRTGYSSVLDLESVSAEFVETGVWE